jgi:hypothetical protein
MYSSFRMTLASLALALGPACVAAQTRSIVGTWRGTSTCVDKEHFPGCNDEQVVYEIRLTHSAPDTVTVRADKIVNGVRQFMGDLSFTPQDDSAWTTDFRTPRVHFLMRLHPVGDRMTGTMTDAASGRRIRDIALERSR